MYVYNGKNNTSTDGQVHLVTCKFLNVYKTTHCLQSFSLGSPLPFDMVISIHLIQTKGKQGVGTLTVTLDVILFPQYLT